jgi:chemotaxis protein methyltransferase CheR
MADRIRPLTPREFEKIRRLAYDKFGLDLRSGKEELVSARLRKKVHARGLRTFQEYYDYVLGDPTGSAIEEMIDALTTNYTSFFREQVHFDLLRNAIAPALASKTGIQIWSAACATGEEPYTIAICLADALGPEQASRIRILATDISNRALDTARKGAYPAGHFDNFPKDGMRRHLLKGAKQWEGWYRIKPEIREMVEFRRLNLTEPLRKIPKVFVIFCRNVMIYFDKATQESLVERLAERLLPGGYLLTGHSESLVGSNHALEYVQPAVYRKTAGRMDGAGRAKEGKCGR